MTITTTPSTVSHPAPSGSPLDDLDRLRRTVHGTVLAGDDPGTAAEVFAFNTAVTHRPSVVVGAACADDVVAAVRFAIRHRLTLGVQATGHGAARPMRGGLLVTTHRMAEVSVDPVRRTARIGAGAKWAKVIAAAAPYGLAPLSGSTSDVGAVGYTLGGGMGPMGRRYGFAADRVRSVEIVTGDGRLRTVCPDDPTGLFWGVRGGKGNLGIVTAIEVDLVPVSRLYGGAIFFPAKDAAAVLHTWREWVQTVPEEMTSSVALLRIPDIEGAPPPLRGRLSVHLRIAYLGEAADGARLVAPLRAVAPALLDGVREMPFTESDSIHLDPTTPGPSWVSSMLLADLPAEAVDALLATAGPEVDVPLIMAELRHMGGALRRPPEVPNAVAGRDAAYSLFLLGPEAPGVGRAVSLAGAAVLEALAAWRASQRLVNFLGSEDETRAVTRAYPAEVAARLSELKDRFDPHGLFRYGHTLSGGAR